MLYYTSYYTKRHASSIDSYFIHQISISIADLNDNFCAYFLDFLITLKTLQQFSSKCYLDIVSSLFLILHLLKDTISENSKFDIFGNLIILVFCILIFVNLGVALFQSIIQVYQTFKEFGRKNEVRIFEEKKTDIKMLNEKASPEGKNLVN